MGKKKKSTKKKSAKADNRRIGRFTSDGSEISLVKKKDEVIKEARK